MDFKELKKSLKAIESFEERNRKAKEQIKIAKKIVEERASEVIDLLAGSDLKAFEHIKDIFYPRGYTSSEPFSIEDFQYEISDTVDCGKYEDCNALLTINLYQLTEEKDLMWYASADIPREWFFDETLSFTLIAARGKEEEDEQYKKFKEIFNTIFGKKFLQRMEDEGILEKHLPACYTNYDE
jgi:hypothetical protein